MIVVFVRYLRESLFPAQILTFVVVVLLEPLPLYGRHAVAAPLALGLQLDVAEAEVGLGRVRQEVEVVSGVGLAGLRVLLDEAVRGQDGVEVSITAAGALGPHLIRLVTSHIVVTLHSRVTLCYIVTLSQLQIAAKATLREVMAKGHLKG